MEDKYETIELSCCWQIILLFIVFY